MKKTKQLKYHCSLALEKVGAIYWICHVLPSCCDSVIPWPFIWKFSSHFSQDLRGLQSWNLTHTWTIGGYTVYTGIRLLLLICPLISSFFFLSNVQTLKLLVIFFSGIVRPTKLKVGTHVDNWWMYRVYRNQGAAAYLSLYFFHFSFQFSNIKNFRHTFLRDCEAYKVVTWYARGQWVDVSWVLLLIRPFISSFFFLSNFQTLTFFVTLFSGTVRPIKLKLGTHVDNGWMHRVYRNQAAAYSFLYLFIFLSNFQTKKFSSHFSQEIFVHTWTMGGCIVHARIWLLLVICVLFPIFFSLQFSVTNVSFSLDSTV